MHAFAHLLMCSLSFYNFELRKSLTYASTIYFRENIWSVATPLPHAPFRHCDTRLIMNDFSLRQNTIQVREAVFYDWLGRGQTLFAPKTFPNKSFIVCHCFLRQNENVTKRKLLQIVL